MFKLLILRVRPSKCDHDKGSTRIVDVQRFSDAAPHGRKKIDGAFGPKEVSRSVDEQGLAMLLKHLLLQNGDGRRVASKIVPAPRVTSENANSRSGGQLRIDVPDGCKKVRVNRRVPNSVSLGCRFPNL